MESLHSQTQCYLGGEEKGMGVGRVRNFLILYVEYIPLLVFVNIELLRKRNIFRGGIGGRGGDKLVFGIRDNPRPPPPKRNPAWTPKFFLLFFWSAEVASTWINLDKLEDLKVLYHGSDNHPYNLHISLQILKRASLVGLRPVVYLLSAFYIQTKLTPAFSVMATYTPPLAYLKLRKL